jgi:hypothetical protein
MPLWISTEGNERERERERERDENKYLRETIQVLQPRICFNETFNELSHYICNQNSLSGNLAKVKPRISHAHYSPTFKCAKVS